MLRPLSHSASRPLRSTVGSYAIVASLYNSEYVDPMLSAAKRELKRAGAKEVRVIRVPGAYEVPLVTASLAKASARAADNDREKLHAILCLGVILRGETVHAAHIGEAVSSALMQIQLDYLVPIIHEVLLLENVEQAKARCLGVKHNRGMEAAQTALAMAEVMRNLGVNKGV